MSSRPSRLALGWFVAVAGFGVAGVLLSLLLERGLGPLSREAVSKTFLLSTLLLGLVSSGLAMADRAARAEKQIRLRAALGGSVAAAVLFLAAQRIGLAALLDAMDTEVAPTGTGMFLFVAVALHALHVGIGAGWLVYATLQGFAGRYDHECRWGLTVCGWLWHALLLVWLGILTVFLVAW